MNNSNQMSASEKLAFLTLIKNSETLKCPQCGNESFYEGVKLKKISRFITKEDKDTILPVPGFYCIKCTSELNFDTPSSDVPVPPSVPETSNIIQIQ